MTASRVMLSGLIPLAVQSMTLNNSTATAVNSTTQGAQALMFSVETTDCRVRFDATDAANSTGVVFASGETYFLEGFDGTSNLTFCRSGASGTSSVTIQPFKHYG